MRHLLHRDLCRVLGTAALLSITACVSTGDSSYEAADLSEADITTLTTAIVDAVNLAFAPAKTVFALQPAGPVGSRVARHLRALGYGVTQHRTQDALSLRYTVSHYASRVLYLGVSVAPGWRADRLFTADLDDKLQPANMATFRDDEQRMVHRRTALPTLPATIHSTMASTAAATSDPIPPPEIKILAAAGTTATDNKNQCGNVALEAGSLRASITKTLSRCGYALGDWAIGEGGYIDDWILQQPYAVTVSGGIEGVLKLLDAHYAITGKIRPISQTVDFSYRGNAL